MKLFETIHDQFRHRSIAFARRYAAVRRPDLLFILAEVGHPNGSVRVRWLEVCDEDCRVGESFKLDAIPALQLMDRCPGELSQLQADNQIWRSAYSSRGRDGLQVVIGLIMRDKVQWRQFWNPDLESEPLVRVMKLMDTAQNSILESNDHDSDK